MSCVHVNAVHACRRVKESSILLPLLLLFLLLLLVVVVVVGVCWGQV